MKKLFLSIVITTLLINQLTAQVPRKVIVEHFTNTYCSICAARNPGFYNNLSLFPQVIHIAYHPSSPYPACPLNQHNKPENDDRTNFYGIYGSTPRIVIQGNIIPANADYTSAMLFQSQVGQTTNFDVGITFHQINSGMTEVKAVVKKVAVDNLTFAQLYLAIVEDTLFFNANNGENSHYDVFRKSVFGMPLTLSMPLNVGDSIVQTQQVALNAAWDKNRLYAVGILQDENKGVLQAAKSGYLSVVSTVAGISDEEVAVFPNPAANMIYISGLKDFATYKIIDFNGRIVGSGSTTGTINISGLNSGVYQLVMTTPHTLRTIKVIKL